MGRKQDHGPRVPLMRLVTSEGGDDRCGALAPAEALGRAASFVDRQADLVDDEETANFLRYHAADLRLEAFAHATGLAESP
jgi:hypothetical protein